jgi:phage gp29-like protein
MRIPFLSKKSRPESAAQTTIWQRRAAAEPGAPGPLSYATYDEMERDAMVQTALTVKRLGVLAAKWTIESCGDAARDRLANDLLSRMEGDPVSVLQGAMDAFAKGWSVQEMVLEQEAGRVWLRAVRPKDPSSFGVELDEFGAMTGLVLKVPGEAERKLPLGKFIVYRHRSGYARPKGMSDLDAAYPHWQAKRRLLEAWRSHLARFASPTLLGRYGSTVPAAQQEALLGALNGIAQHSALTVPADIEVETLAGHADASTGFMDAIAFHNREIARSILGQTLTTDEGARVGSLALGRVHLQVMLLQLQALRREMAEAVITEGLLRPLIELNLGPGPTPRFTFEETPVPAFTAGTA